MTDLLEILYCSVLSQDQPPTVVGQIIARARARNPARDVTGLLVFDGMRFCQHFEGPRHHLMDLMSLIGDDPRHTAVRVVYEGPIVQRRYRGFELGLAQVEGKEDLEEVRQLDGLPALERFLTLRSRFDISS